MAAPVEAGQILAGKYRVDRVLGEGGMGVVVAATDTQLERQVAIKFLLPEYARHPEASARFMREARAAVKIQSEHIARVIDVNQMENGSPYMVMQFLEGSDLSGVIEQHKQLPVEEAVGHVIQACDAIAEAHSYGIVHRDLKPANLFLARQPDNSFKVKVLDFGISKTTVPSESGFDASLTRTSSMMGSPLYMSPEQMRSTRDVDSRTDIWALGVILYELLAGALPFTGNSVPELSARILLEEPAPLTVYRQDVPPELAAIVMRTLQKDPNNRYPSISEFALELLPFAPRKCRANVERITRVLSQAGLSSSSMDNHSMPPSAHGSTVVARTGGPASTSNTQPDAGGPTITGFGGTRPEIPTHGVGKWVAIGSLAALLLMGGVAFAVFGGGEEPEDAAAAQASAEPLPEPEPPAAAPEPEPEPKVEVAPEPEPAPSAEPEPKPAPVAVKPKPRPVARRTTTVRKPAPKSTATAKPVTTTAPRTTTKSSTSTSTSGGFKSKFGGRK